MTAAIAPRRPRPSSGAARTSPDGKPEGRARPDLDRGILPGLVGFHLRQAQIAVFRDFTATMGELEITPGLFAVLVLIESNPGLKQTELARAVHLDRSTRRLGARQPGAARPGDAPHRRPRPPLQRAGADRRRRRRC